MKSPNLRLPPLWPLTNLCKFSSFLNWYLSPMYHVSLVSLYHGLMSLMYHVIFMSHVSHVSLCLIVSHVSDVSDVWATCVNPSLSSKLFSATLSPSVLITTRTLDKFIKAYTLKFTFHYLCLNAFINSDLNFTSASLPSSSASLQQISILPIRFKKCILWEKSHFQRNLAIIIFIIKDIRIP